MAETEQPDINLEETQLQ